MRDELKRSENTKPPITEKTVSSIRTGDSVRIDNTLGSRVGRAARDSLGNVRVRCNGSTVVYDRFGRRVRG